MPHGHYPDGMDFAAITATPLDEGLEFRACAASVLAKTLAATEFALTQAEAADPELGDAYTDALIELRRCLEDHAGTIKDAANQEYV